MNELAVTQWIRIADVLVIGPLMIYVGVVGRPSLPPLVSNAIVAAGVGTIVYNGVNYARHRTSR